MWVESIPGQAEGPQGLAPQLPLLPYRPQTECSGVLRGHGIWPLQRALHPSHLSGKQVSVKGNPDAPHFLL